MTSTLDENVRNSYELQVRAAAKHIQSKMGDRSPVVGIVLGSGLGSLGDQIDGTRIPYAEIPHFPKTTVLGHEGTLVIGDIEGVPVIGLKGRKHFYEVADVPGNAGILQCVFAVHVLAELGVRDYFVTNAAGGLNLSYQVGDLMIIKSHVNFLPNPLLGKHHDFTRVDNGQLVERFQPMNDAYDSHLRTLLLQAAGHSSSRTWNRFASLFSQPHIVEGTYLAVTGPTYETEAECIAFRDGLRTDAVGMSTTAEVIVAKNRGMRVVGMSCITNKIAKDGTNATNHEEVKAILDSDEVKDRLTSTVKRYFELYKQHFV